MQLQSTRHFEEECLALHIRDSGAVDEMLDTLEDEHDQPYMRNGIKVGSVALFATPRFNAPSGAYRITWQYNDRQKPTVITCLTVAEAGVRRPI